jgi:peptidoglycan/LPS O-acetylase OafA/YrhL
MLLVASGTISAARVWPHLLASTVYVHNALFGGMSAVNYVTWSLEIEVQFYVLAPLLSLLFKLGKTTRRSVFLGASVVVPLVNTLIPWESRYRLTLPFYVHLFLLGFFLADLYMSDWRYAPPRGRLWDALGAVAWIALAPAKAHGTAGQMLLPWLVLVAYVGAFRGTTLNRIVRAPWLMTIGGMCYTIYLYHPLVIPIAGRLMLMLVQPASYWAGLLLVGLPIVAVVLLVSATMFLLCEKPFMQRGWHRAVLARLTAARS